MAGKQLSIVVQAQDRASNIFRQVQSGIGSFAASAVSGMGKVASAAAAATSLLNPFTSVFKFLGIAGGVGGAFYFLKSTAEEITKIGGAGKKLGITTAEMAAMGYQAKFLKVDLEDVVEGAEKFAVAISRFTRTGGGQVKDIFKDLNVELTDGKGNLRNFNELLPETLRAIGEIESPARKLEFVRRLFGDDKLIKFVNAGPGVLAALRQEAGALNLVFGDDAVSKSKKFLQGVLRVQSAVQGLRLTLFSQVPVDFFGKLANVAAGAIASIPDLIGNAARVIRGVVAGDEKIRAAVGETIFSLVRLSEISLRAAGPVLAAAVGNVVGGVFDYASPILKAKAVEMFGSVFRFVGDKFSSLFAAGSPMTYVMRYMGDAFEELANSSDLWASSIRRVDMETLTRRSMAAADAGSDLAKAWQFVRSSIGPALGDAGAKIDNLLGITDTLAKHAVGVSDAFSAMNDKIYMAERRTTGWGGAVDGVSQAWRDLKDKSENTYNFAISATTQLADSFSSGLAGAIISTVENVRDAGRAFREFFAGLFRQIAQATLQFAIMRAVVGIAGAFAGAPGGAPGGVGPIDLRPLHGGTVAAGGALHFQSGGIVPGNTKRDFYPALLASGEGVVNNRGMERLGPRGLHALNTGGSVGGGISIGGATVVVNVSAPSGSLSKNEVGKIQEAVTRGVLETLERSPAMRQRMRSGLG